jgi:VWFA-related protein
VLNRKAKSKKQKATVKHLSGLISLMLCVGCALHAAPRQVQETQNTQKSKDEVLTLKTRLVNIEVMVKDKKGKYLTDLKAEDFTVFENGVRQKVEFFDPPLAGSIEATTSTPAQTKPIPTSGAPANILSLVIDGQTTELANLKQVREGTIKYIRERITDTDMVAVFGVGHDLQLLQSFTQDKAKLIAAVEKAYTLTAANRNLERNDTAEQIARLRDELSGLPGGNLPQSPAAAAQGSAAARAMIASRALEQFIKLRAQLSVQQARPILAALAAICEAQRIIPGKKTVVLFSQGFTTSSILDWQVQSTIDLANRANVAIYIIDSTGLTGGDPQSGAFVSSGALGGVAATGSPEGRSKAVGGESVFDNVRHEGIKREQDILYRISGDTGGEFMKGNNDIGKGLERIDQDIRARYTLAYYSTDANFDGSYRKLKIEVHKPDTHAITRAGYYAIGDDDIVLLSVEDKKLLTRLAEAENNPALPLFVELSPFRTSEGRYVVPLSLEVPSTAVKFDQKGDKQFLQLDVLGVIRETPEKIVSKLGGGFNIGLGAEQYQSIVNNNIFYRQDMELTPGTYQIELIVRDRISGKLTAKKEKLVLPNPGSEFATSGVVLSRLALASNNPPAGKPSTDVFNQGGIQIRPSASREFRVTDNLILFFELYNAALNAETSKPMVRVTLTVMKDDKVVIKPIDYVLTEVQATPVPHLIFAKYIKLAGLAAGTYTAKLEARDMVTNKLVTQQSPFVIRQ